MTNNDLKQIGDLVDQKLDQRLTETETRFTTQLQNAIATVNNKIDNISSFIEDTLLPVMDERFDAVDERLEEKADKTDIDRLESKIDKLIDTDLDHERKIKDIEAVPVVAHQLNLKKSK